LALSLLASNAALSADLPAGVVEGSAARRADAALQALSERYSQRWAALGASEKLQFASRERAWLNHDRWVEHKACVVQRGEAAADECLAEIVQRRIGAL
jgi:hypothetical protein